MGVGWELEEDNGGWACEGEEVGEDVRRSVAWKASMNRSGWTENAQRWRWRRNMASPKRQIVKWVARIEIIESSQ